MVILDTMTNVRHGKLSEMAKHKVRRFTALVVGCGAAGLAIGWTYAERGRPVRVTPGR